MLIYLSIAGIILSVILLYFNARRYQSTLYLGLFFLVISLYGINQYVLLYSKSVVLVALIVTNISFAFYLIGPLLYWYIRSILTDNSRLKRTDLLHLVPMVVYLAAALPYMLSPFAHKLEIAKEIINDLGFLSNFNFTVLSAVFSNTAVYLSRPLLALGYTLWAIGIFLRYLTQREKIIVLSGQIFMMKWLAVFLGFQLLLIVCHLSAIFITFTAGSDVFFTLNTLQLLSAVGMIGLLSSPLFFPSILYGLPQIPNSFLRKKM
jgi:hypothetical protein